MRAIKNIDAEIIVTDNNSTDGSNNFLSNKFAGVQFLWLPQNVGFSTANNIALQKAAGKYILFLNPDTLVAEDTLEKCIAFFESKPNMGALGIRMIDGTGEYLKESKRGFPSPLTSFFKLSGLTALFPHSKLFAQYYLGHLPEHSTNEADVLSGAFMMSTKSILDTIGSFDEAFFMYGEDVDLSYRIQKAEYKNYYFAESTIIHFKGESTKRESLKYINLFYGAMDLFVKKHYSGFEAGFYSVFIHAAIGLKAVSNFFKKLFSGGKINKNLAGKVLPAIIVGSKADYDAVVDVLKKAGSLIEIIGRVEVDKIAPGTSLGSFEQLPEIIKTRGIQKLIFCIGELTVKEVIDFVGNVDLDVSYSFYAVGSDSIVGSNNKNEAGDIVGVG